MTIRHSDDPFDTPFGEDRPMGVVRVGEVFPKTGPWSNNNKLGAVVQADRIGANYQLLKTDEWWFPHVWTVSLWAQHRNLLPDNPAIPTTEAVIEFGVGGSTQQVEVDFKRGTTLSLVTNSIVVRIVRATPDSQIYAQASLGTRGPCGCPQKQLLKNAQVLAGAASAPLPLPAFTSKLVVTRGESGDIAAADIFVDLSRKLSTPVEIIQSTPLSVLTTAYGGHLPVSSDAVAVRVLNSSANPVFLNIYAELGL